MAGSPSSSTASTHGAAPPPPRQCFEWPDKHRPRWHHLLGGWRSPQRVRISLERPQPPCLIGGSLSVQSICLRARPRLQCLLNGNHEGRLGSAGRLLGAACDSRGIGLGISQQWSPAALEGWVGGPLRFEGTSKHRLYPDRRPGPAIGLS